MLKIDEKVTVSARTLAAALTGKIRAPGREEFLHAQEVLALVKMEQRTEKVNETA